MKSLYLLLLVLFVSVSSCRTKEGEPGPAGQSNLMKQGSISGTISFTDDNGNDTSTTFNYQYYESLVDNKFYFEDNSPETYYEFEFGRRDLKDYNNYFTFDCYGYGMNQIEEETYINDFDFSVLSVMNNELYEFNPYEVFEITNVNLDESTGRVTFDFSGDAYSNNGAATLTGKVDVILNRSGSYPK